MSYRANQFNQRLKRVANIIRPDNSLAYRIHSLSEHDRAVYERFKEEYRHWSERFEGEELYIQLLECIEGKSENRMPTLPPRIEAQLYPPSRYTNPHDIYQELREGII